MKLQAEARQEFCHIAVGTAVCTAIMWAVFALLHLAGLAPLNSSVFLGGAGGAAVAVLNFYLLCATVQKAASQAEINRKGILQLSYNGRLLGQAVWCLLAFALPCFQLVAAVLPLLFPRVVIYYRQITGKYRTAQPGQAAPAQQEQPDPEQTPSDPGGKGGET